MFAVAAGVAAAIVGLVRLLHDAYHLAAARLLRFLPDFVSRLIATALIVVLAVGLATGFAQQVLLRWANATASAANHGTEAGVSRPVSPLRSGSPASFVSWESLGRKGRSFVGSGPTDTDVARFTGRRAIEPIRVYAGEASAGNLHEEAALVLRELKRTGGFDRSLLAVATATGSGWVDASLVDPLEYMYGGDTAIASMQYSYLPSWIAFLSEQARAREAGRELFDTIYDYWATLPAAGRPRLVVVGESLGAYGAQSAFSGLADLTARTSGALFAGTPNSTDLWRQLTDRRAGNSPERLPIYGDGRTVAFAASAADLRQADGTLRHPSVVYLQHASDPIVWWSTDLAATAARLARGTPRSGRRTADALVPVRHVLAGHRRSDRAATRYRPATDTATARRSPPPGPPSCTHPAGPTRTRTGSAPLRLRPRPARVVELSSAPGPCTARTRPRR